MNNDSDNKSIELQSSPDTRAQADVAFSVLNKFPEDPSSRPFPSAEGASEAALIDMKAEIEKIVSSIEGLARKTTNISETTGRAITELRSRSDFFEKSVSQITKTSRNLMLFASILGVLGLMVYTVISIFLALELRKNGSAFDSFELKMNQISSATSQLSPVLNEIKELSGGQESVHSAIVQVDKNIELAMQKVWPEKQLQAIEKMLTAQSDRLAKLEREIYQAKVAYKKNDTALLRKEIDSAFRHQRELAEAASKKTAAPVHDVRSQDPRPQYPRTENRQPVSSP